MDEMRCARKEWVGMADDYKKVSQRSDRGWLSSWNLWSGNTILTVVFNNKLK